MADAAAGVLGPTLRPHSTFPRRVSGPDPAAMREGSAPAHRPEARRGAAGPSGPGGNGLGVAAIAFAEGETGTFHPSGEARKQEEGDGEGCGRRGPPWGAGRGVRAARAPFQRSQVRLDGLISISDQLLGLPEASQGVGGAQEQGRGGCQAGLASSEWRPEQGQCGEGTQLPHRSEAGFPGKSGVRGWAGCAPA